MKQHQKQRCIAFVTVATDIDGLLCVGVAGDAV